MQSCGPPTATRWSHRDFASRLSICSARANPTSQRLFISQDDQVAALGIADRTARRRSGLPQRDQLRRPDRAALRDRAWRAGSPGLVPMSALRSSRRSCSCSATPLRTGLILGGTGYLQDLLLPMNLSDEWLGPLLDKLDAVKRQGWLINDVYALQNLMESFLDFQAADAATCLDQRPDHDPERRVRFPDPSRAA